MQSRLESQFLKKDAELKLSFAHRLVFTQGAFDTDNPVLGEALEADERSKARTLVFVDSGVEAGHPGLGHRIERYLRNQPHIELAGPLQRVGGGEDCKNETAAVLEILEAIHGAGLCRHSYVLVIGGGAILDVVGFAAAIAHRGVRLVRMPTTTLAQGDSGVGVKNGINFFGKKNYLGVFAPPWAVINDEELLRTLSDRDWRSGFSEAVKVALIKDEELTRWLARNAWRIRERDPEASRYALQRSAELHMNHIVYGGDPFEMTEARPLDFGHWSAHKLEQLTDFRLRHGEAVAIGVALDVVYSALTRSLPWPDAEMVLDGLADLGFELYDPELEDTEALFAGIDEFREHLGGRLTVTLVETLGEKVDVHEIDRYRMLEALGVLRERALAELPRVAAL